MKLLCLLASLWQEKWSERNEIRFYASQIRLTSCGVVDEPNQSLLFLPKPPQSSKKHTIVRNGSSFYILLYFFFMDILSDIWYHEKLHNSRIPINPSLQPIAYPLQENDSVILFHFDKIIHNLQCTEFSYTSMKYNNCNNKIWWIVWNASNYLWNDRSQRLWMPASVSQIDGQERGRKMKWIISKWKCDMWKVRQMMVVVVRHLTFGIWNMSRSKYFISISTNSLKSRLGNHKKNNG